VVRRSSKLALINPLNAIDAIDAIDAVDRKPQRARGLAMTIETELEPTSEIFQALYRAHGDIDLHEVMHLNPTPNERIPVLRQALRHPLEYVHFHATLVLVAWGDRAGLDQLADYLALPAGDLARSPNRFVNRHLYLDEIGDALLTGVVRGNLRWSQAQPYVRRLLAIYHNHHFGNRFVWGLRHPAVPAEIVPDLLDAFDNTMAAGKLAEASRLLRPLAPRDPDATWAAIRKLEAEPQNRPCYAHDVAYVLPAVRTPASQALAEELAAQGYAPHPLAVAGQLCSAPA